MRTLVSLSLLFVLSAAFSVQASAQCCEPTVTYYAPAPTVTYYAPAPTVTYYAPQTTYYAPAPTVTYYAPQTTYYAPTAVYARPGLLGWRWRRAWRRSVWAGQGASIQPVPY